MAYERQTFEDFKTVLVAEHLDKIQDGILGIQMNIQVPHFLVGMVALANHRDLIKLDFQ